jgi:hypothetical protein
VTRLAPGPAPRALRPAPGEAAARALLAAGILAFFWPVLLGRIPATGDALFHGFPHLALLGRAVSAGSAPLWNRYEFSGFPWLASGQAGVLYPLNWLAAILPAPTAMSVGVLLAYLIAALGAYRLARHLGAPPLAGLVAGYTYALGGFMIANLGHTAMVHAAAWLPWVFLGAEHLRGRMRWPWFAAMAGIVGLQVLAGHVQVPVYGGLVVAVYALAAGGEVPGWRARLGWVGRVGLAGATGGLLAAVQILPTLELARASARARITYEFFSQFHLPLHQLPMLLFPYLFGGAPAPSPFPATYVGSWNLGGLTGYAGIFPLVLAIAAGTALWREPRARGWAAVGVTALLLALGPETPVPRLLFAVPGYHWFRVPTRHLMSFGLAVAILAALGLGRMLDPHGDAVRRRASRCAGVVAGGMGVFAAVTLVGPPGLAEVLAPWHPDGPARALALLVPLGLAVLTVAMCARLRRARSRAAECLAACLTLLDLGSFGQAFGWGAWPTGGDLRHVPAPIALLRRAATEPAFRIFTGLRDPAVLDQAGLGLPLRVALHGAESVNGYDPLILRRYAEFLGMSPGGVVSDLWGLTRGRQLDLLGARYVLVPQPRRIATRAGPLIVLGAGEAIEFPVGGLEAVALRVGSTVASAGDLPRGTPVARLVVTGTGEATVASLRAGIETGIYHPPRSRDAPGLSPPPGTGPIFTTDAAGRVGIALYEGRVPLPPERRIVRVRIEHASAAPDVYVGVGEVRVVERHGGEVALTGPTAALAIPPHWVRVFRGATVEVYENPSALPLAWLVPRTLALPDEAQVLAAIRSGRLPDGAPFDPRAVALLSGGHAPWATGRADPANRVETRSVSANRIEVEVSAAAGGTLVFSEVDYPGWRATLDGAPVRHYRTNYLLRGLPIPPGTHRVTFVFLPSSVLFGALISAGAGMVLATLAWRGRRGKDS